MVLLLSGDESLEMTGFLVFFKAWRMASAMREVSSDSFVAHLTLRLRLGGGGVARCGWRFCKCLRRSPLLFAW